MANPNYQLFTATGAGPAIVVDHFQTPFNLSYAVELASGATVTGQVEATYDDPNDSTWTTVWMNVGSSVTANTSGALTSPVRAIRFVPSAITGQVRFCVIQGMNLRAG